jgi:protein translocase SecG subunit
MMTFLTYLLSAILVADCLLLILLVLVQLPKKEAGMGMAFGGGAADALFGAGSGNALTKLTKYSAGAFFALVILLCFLSGNGSSTDQGLRRALDSTSAPTQPAAPAATPAATAISSNSSAPALPLTIGNNATPSTNAPSVTTPVTNNSPK